MGPPRVARALRWALVCICGIAVLLAGPNSVAATAPLSLSRLRSDVSDLVSSSPNPLAGGRSRAASRRATSVPPVLESGALLLDNDNGTTIFEGALDWETVGGGGGQNGGPITFTHTFTYDSEAEFVLLTLNQSVSQMNISVSVHGGRMSLVNPAGGDVSGATGNYLESLDPHWLERHPYQTYQLKPSEFRKPCMAFLHACEVTVTMRLMGRVNSPTPMVPYRLSMLRGPMLSYGQSNDVYGVPAGRTLTFGLEVSSATTDVLLQQIAIPPSGDHSASDLTTDTVMFLYNALNPVQYWFPTRDSVGMHEFGAEIDVLLQEDSFALSSSGEARPRLSSTVTSLPTEGGHPYADPYVRSGRLVPSLYLITVWPSLESQPQPYDIPNIGKQDKTKSYFEILATADWSPSSPSFGVSMFGIVGALTVLLLCVCSGLFVMLRRRITMQHAQDGLQEVVAMQVLSRQQRAELPTVGPDGRPIRYDAYGRVLPDLGARKEEIEALPSEPFRAGMMPTEDATCTVCLGEYAEGEMLRTLPCGHIFHAPCIDKWLLGNKKCVLCQQNIDTAQNVKGHLSPDEVARGEGTPLNQVSAAAVTDGGSPSPQPVGTLGAAFTDPEAAAGSPISSPRIHDDVGVADTNRLSLPAAATSRAMSASSNVTPRSSRGGSGRSSQSTVGERLHSPPSRRQISSQQVTLHGVSAVALQPLPLPQHVNAPGCVESKDDVEEEEQKQSHHRLSRSASASASAAGQSQSNRISGATPAASPAPDLDI